MLSRSLSHDLQRAGAQRSLRPAEMMYRDVDSEDDDDESIDTVICAICALPASNGGRDEDARCAGCDETTGWLIAAPPSVPDALGRTLRDALVEASAKVASTDWLGQGEQPERSLQANLRALSAAMLRAAARRAEFSPGSNQRSTSELTAVEVTRAVCIGPALVAAARVLGSAQLMAPLSRTVRLALLACENAPGTSATAVASRSATFVAALEKLRNAADADAPITLQALCSAVCTPQALELAEAALHGEDRAMTLACTNGTMHGAGCDCGAVMGGGFL